MNSFFSQLDGTIIAPTNSNVWGKGLLWWIEFTKLKGITIQGTGTIDGSGSVWWQDYPFDDPLDDETKLIIPLNHTVEEHPPMPVITLSLYFSCICLYYMHLIMLLAKLCGR